MTDERQGPIEARPPDTQLPAKAVTPGPRPQLYGYDVHGDLAQHYRLSEMAWLAVQGELPPSEAHGQAFEVVLAHLFPVQPQEAPSHVASLARRCGSKPGEVTALAAASLAEQARAFVEAHADLYAWLADRSRPWPLAASDADVAPVRTMKRQLEALGVEGLDLGVFERRPGLRAACAAVLHGLGFEAPEQLTTLWVWCRLPCAMAEALTVRRGRLGDYPMDLPKMEYEG